MIAGNYNINLNRETFELLQKVRDDLGIKLGFEPTYGQVVRHLISMYNTGTQSGFVPPPPLGLV